MWSEIWGQVYGNYLKSLTNSGLPLKVFGIDKRKRELASKISTKFLPTNEVKEEINFTPLFPLIHVDPNAIKKKQIQQAKKIFFPGDK
ncbi:MAG: hypothetical protein Q7S61_04255 [bacterium]|nr:hypothetical protein [bacterium]